MANLQVMKDASEVVHYDNPQVPLYIVSARLSHMSDMRAFCHWHDDIEFTHAVRGHMMYDVNGKKVKIPAGGGIMVTPHQMHFGYSDDGTDCEFICVVFRPQLLSWNKELWEKYILPIENTGRFPYVSLLPNRESDGKILRMMRELLKIKKSTVLCPELDEIAVLHKMWAELFRNLQQDIPISFSDGRDVASFKNMLGYLYKNYGKKITLEEIAGAGGVGRSTCCAMFHKTLGRSPIDYLNTYRIEVGVNLLTTTAKSVTDIAFACGFTSSSYFAEEFRKVKGCTPMEYRNKQRQK